MSKKNIKYIIMVFIFTVILSLPSIVRAVILTGSLPYDVVAGPTVTVWADSTLIPINTTTVIRWESTNATSCTRPGVTGNIGTSGWFETDDLLSTTTFSITCSD